MKEYGGYDILFFHFSDLWFHLFEVRVDFALGVGQRFLDHQEFVEFVGYIEIGFLHLHAKEIQIWYP